MLNWSNERAEPTNWYFKIRMTYLSEAICYPIKWYIVGVVSCTNGYNFFGTFLSHEKNNSKLASYSLWHKTNNSAMACLNVRQKENGGKKKLNKK